MAAHLISIDGICFYTSLKFESLCRKMRAIATLEVVARFAGRRVVP
jgi:hypothetical protein